MHLSMLSRCRGVWALEGDLTLQICPWGMFKTQNDEMAKWRNGEMVLEIRAKVVRLLFH